MPKAPDYPIAPILDDLGAVDTPAVTGTRSRRMLCPFHPDRTPSASVTQYGFVCWACGVQGDAISLLMKQGGMTFADAVARASTLNGGAGGQTPPAVEGGRWGGGSLLSE